MLRQASIQQLLKQSFPEFRDKKILIEYYICFEFPQRQVKMLNWWQKVIEFIIEKQNKIFITYSQLVNYVTIYNLKPVPLQEIIKNLSKKDILVEENEVENKESANKENKENNKSWFSNILSYVTKSKEQPCKFKFENTQKIFSKKLKDYQKQKLKTLLAKLFDDHVKSMDEFKLNEIIQSKLNLDQISVKQLIYELYHEKHIKLVTHSQKKIILYSNNAYDMNNAEWVELESMKFKLKQQISKFQYIKSIEEQKISSLNAKARQFVRSNNKLTARAILIQILQKEKKMKNISTRMTILENQLTQLQYNQMNKSTMFLLEQSNKIYQQTMVDENKLDQIIQKNLQMQQINNETNTKFEMMGEKDEAQDEVDKMMNELGKQVESDKRMMVEKKRIQVNIPMDVEIECKQQSQKVNHFQMKSN